MDGSYEPENTFPPPEPAMRSIVDVAENLFLDWKPEPTPPSWLVAADEVSTTDDPIDSEGLTKIFVGEWQDVPMAVKRFDVVGDNPVFDKHFKIWRTLLHPHVAQLYGAGFRDGPPFFVYEQGGVKLFGFGASDIRINNRSNIIKLEIREEFAAPECIGIGPSGKDCGIRHSPNFESDVYSFGLTVLEAVGKENLLDGISSRCDVR
ncbi:hypothetical protein DVH05_019595 [Phytophthora capsici]|nr:hypothetical protein DVH05_019595 [Phytophthora capsici]